MTKLLLGNHFIGTFPVARFYKPQKKKIAQGFEIINIDSMNHEGLGVARKNNKVIFVEGALSGEKVKAKQVANKSRYEKYTTVNVIEPSQYRVDPFCKHYTVCGGCQLQHLESEQQVVEKQIAVKRLFEKFAGAAELPWQAHLPSNTQHYRRSGRIAVIYDKTQSNFLVGYRQKQSKKIVNISQCAVLTQQWQPVFKQVRSLLPNLKAGQGISHLQLCSVDSGDYLIIRHTKALPKTDIEKLEALCDSHSWKLVLNSEKGMYSSDEKLFYRFKFTDLKLHFGFENFIQVNEQINESMVQQALSWLKITEEDKVLDLFCGIGNFTLPLAQISKEVVGVEGVSSAIEMARYNAKANGLQNLDFYCQDLTENIQKQDWFNRDYSVLLLDPSRMGAFDILNQLKLKRFSRVLYVACDPVTMARDSRLLIEAGFKVTKISLMNMFPNTSHIETMALFEKESE